MKILAINWQDITHPQGGGAEVHFHEIFKRLVARGCEVTLLASKFPGAKDEEIIDGIKIVRRGSRSTFNFFVPGFYKKLAKENKYDIVIDDINKIPFYTPRYVKEPLLAISHHFFGDSIFKETNFIAGYYVKFSEYIMKYFYSNTPFAVVSDSTLQEFNERGYDTSNFVIAPNAIDSSRFPYKILEKEQDPTITYFGRLKKYKSPDHLIKALALVKKNVPNAKLWVIGRGDFRPEMESLALKLGVASDVKFFGFVSEEEKAQLLAKSHVVVNTSVKEGWGITNIEANACGTPVISADSPGLRDSVKVDLSGELYKYGFIEELAARLIRILTDDKTRLKLSKGAIVWAKSFSWDDSADIMLKKIEKTISEFKNK